MREVKFRGKQIDNGEWVYGYLISPDEIMVWDTNYEVGRVFQVDPETIGEFTGLKDKNGVEIYEGDLLKYADDDGVYFEVFYHDGKAKFDCCRSHYQGNRCGGSVPYIDSLSLEKLSVIFIKTRNY